MRIKKTLFSTEIEITQTELRELIYSLPQNCGIIETIIRLLEKVSK